MLILFVDVLFYIFDDDIKFIVLCFIDILVSKKSMKKRFVRFFFVFFIL